MRLFVAAITVTSLSACTLTPGQQNAFDQACQALTAAYTVYSTEGKPNAKVDAAWEISDRACKNPPTNLALATTQVLLAAYTINRLRS